MKQAVKHNARFVAVQVLPRIEHKRDYASAILNKFLDKTDQRQRATDLVFGTLRNLTAIDAVINTFGGCPANRIQKKLLNIIRVGCYEIVYTPSVAKHSIVDEAAKNTKAIAGQKQVNFVNALLRQILRRIKNRQIPLSQANGKRTLPQNIETGCEFDTDFLHDSDTNAVEYLSTVFSLPQRLVTDWLSEFGNEITRQICFACNRRPSVYIRVNTLKINPNELIEKFRQENIELETVHNDIGSENMLRVKSPGAVSQLPGFDEGLFMVQDLTASQPVKLLEPQKNWRILDLCAAPGGKTTQLAEVTGDSASIIAADIDSERLLKLKENVERLGIKSVEIVDYEQIEGMEFDCVLLDVPCSNSGVLAKRIEMRFRMEPQDITEFAKTQRELLEKAVSMLKPNGTICYSTCSIQRQENSDIIKDFISRNSQFSLITEKFILPSAGEFDHDGGYAAIIRGI
jgi:16S rRNA (cytosine967-C5)-methyltransferase